MAQFDAPTEEEPFCSWQWSLTNFNETGSFNKTKNSFPPSPPDIIAPKAFDLPQTQKETKNLWKCNLFRSDIFDFDNTFSECELSDQEHLTISKDPFNLPSKFISNFSAQNRPLNSQKPLAPLKKRKYLIVMSLSPTALSKKVATITNKKYHADTTFLWGHLLAKHIKENCKQELVPAQKQLKNRHFVPPERHFSPSDIFLAGTEQSMSSDDEYNTTFNQETLISEQPSSKQRPRKKRKVNEEGAH